MAAEPEAKAAPSPSALPERFSGLRRGLLAASRRFEYQSGSRAYNLGCYGFPNRRSAYNRAQVQSRTWSQLRRTLGCSSREDLHTLLPETFKQNRWRDQQARVKVSAGDGCSGDSRCNRCMLPSAHQGELVGIGRNSLHGRHRCRCCED